MATKVKHPGFAGAARNIQRSEGVSKNVADKILGAEKANASEAARRRNPNLNNKPGKKR